MFEPDHKIVMEAFDDPDVPNVTCYLSAAPIPVASKAAPA
ncbi:CreA family protein [Sodalis sp.]